MDGFTASLKAATDQPAGVPLEWQIQLTTTQQIPFLRDRRHTALKLFAVPLRLT